MASLTGTKYIPYIPYKLFQWLSRSSIPYITARCRAGGVLAG
jgi:hypothetical protein